MKAGDAGARSNGDAPPPPAPGAAAGRFSRTRVRWARIRAGADAAAARARGWCAAVPPWAGELTLFLAVAAVTVYRIRTGWRSPGDRAPDALAYGIGLAMTAALPARRRWPALTLAVTDLLWTAYHVRGYPGGAPAVPLWIALYAAAAAPRRWLTLPLAGWVILSDALARTSSRGAGLFDAVLDGTTVVFTAMLLLGDAVRSRRGRRAEYEARLASLAAQRDQAAAQRVAEERIRIARDLHDVSAHTLAVINVQAGVAAELLTEDTAEAGAALAAVRRAAREALGELRAAVGVLRDGTAAPGTDEPAPPPAPGLDRLPDLVRAYGDRGPRIEIRTDGEPRALPRLVGMTGYRIVQEALANALRHADPGLVEITVRYDAGGLTVEVRDDGRRPAAAPGASAGADRERAVPDQEGHPRAGFGLRGIAERVAALDGHLTAGPYDRPGTGERGFLVRAWLPIGGGHDDPRPAGR